MATKIVNMRPNGAPQFFQHFAPVTSAAVTTAQDLGDVFAYDTQEYGDSSTLEVEAFFTSVNNANVKTATIQVSNTPDFAVAATVVSGSLASLPGGKIQGGILFKRGQDLRPYAYNAQGVITELSTLERTKRLYFRVVVTKATGADAVTYEGLRVTLRRESYEYKYNVNLAG